MPLNRRTGADTTGFDSHEEVQSTCPEFMSGWIGTVGPVHGEFLNDAAIGVWLGSAFASSTRGDLLGIESPRWAVLVIGLPAVQACDTHYSNVENR